MELGLVGLPNSGKTVLFNLLVGKETGRSNQGVARVRDQRLKALRDLFQPKKYTPAAINLIDIDGVHPGEADASRLAGFFEQIRKADALVVVVRAFHSDSVPPALGEVDPAGEAKALFTELILADLVVAERNVGKKTKNRDPELDALLKRCVAALEAEKPLSMLELADKEQKLLGDFGFLTSKPVLLAVNVDAHDCAEFAVTKGIVKYAEETGMSHVLFSGEIEMEIADLSDEDQAGFLQEYGIEESSLIRVSKAAYELLGYISFFTVGKDEVRAWSIPRGTKAKEAAGVIHSDIERGFIRAEVADWQTLLDVGSWEKARAEGQLRLEGRDYVVQDGDVISFRFNV